MASQTPVACALTSAELRERRTQVLALLQHRCEERLALPEGVRLQFAPAGETLAALATLIDAERQCCPFLDFELTVAADGGPVWLTLTGPAGTRAFLETELGILVVPR